MDSYNVAMNQQQQRQQYQHQQQQLPQSPRGVTLEDLPPNPHRRNPSQFNSHDDFYEFLESNRGPSMAHPGGPSANERVAMSSPQGPMQQQQQQRNQPGQSRPPVTNSFPDRVSAGARPPSYTGSRPEDLPNDKGAKMARQNVRRGAAPSPNNKPPQSSSGPRQRMSSPTPPESGDSSPTHPQHSRPASDMGSAGASIQRLKSPAIMDSVLQPLEAKVREYDLLMRREQDEIRRLDEEIRVFQARRAEAESRFDDAKAKHDEYRRQYGDVERALSGEPPLSPREPQRPMTMQGAGAGGPTGQGQGQRPMSQRRLGDQGDDEDFDEDDENFTAPYAAGRRISSTQSFGRASQNTARKEKFRFSSLFGGGR